VSRRDVVCEVLELGDELLVDAEVQGALDGAALALGYSDGGRCWRRWRSLRSSRRRWRSRSRARRRRTRAMMVVAPGGVDAREDDDVVGVDVRRRGGFGDADACRPISCMTSSAAGG
jgi:hypothetical protein